MQWTLLLCENLLLLLRKQKSALGKRFTLCSNEHGYDIVTTKQHFTNIT